MVDISMINGDYKDTWYMGNDGKLNNQHVEFMKLKWGCNQRLVISMLSKSVDFFRRGGFNDLTLRSHDQKRHSNLLSFCSEFVVGDNQSKEASYIPAHLYEYVLSNYTKLYQVISSYTNLYQVIPSYIKLYQFIPSYMKLCQIISSFIKFFHRYSNWPPLEELSTLASGAHHTGRWEYPPPLDGSLQLWKMMMV